MRPNLQFFVAMFLAVFAGQGVLASPKQVALDPIEHQDAQLVIESPDGVSVTYTPEMLESFPTYELTTKTPWRDTPATFSGVLLSDLLASHGMSDVTAIVVAAENEFQVVFEREALVAAPVLIATRVDGQAHSRRQRGPIQFIISEDDMRASNALEESHLVWMAASIKAQ